MVGLLFVSLAASSPIYKDPTKPIPLRVQDLLAQMTLEEKVGQLCLIWAKGSANLVNEYKRQKAGAVIEIFGPDTQPIQDAVPSSRLQIPVLFGLDSINGNSFWPGATIYPTQLTTSSAWDPDLCEQIGLATGEEVRNTGVHRIYSPVFCIAREPRWGRVGETFGEDPYLIGELGAAYVKGIESSGIRSCPKHYAGYSETQGGRDTGESDVSVRKLRSWFLPPFKRAVEAGAKTIMSSYQATDGVPSSMNKFLLTDVLRKEWGFEGLVVTDWDGVGDMVKQQRVWATHEEAAAAAINAGVDMVMVSEEFYDAAITSANRGTLTAASLNRAVTKVLTLKFELGLFEDPQPCDLKKVVYGTPEHRALALKAAQESLILLKNDGYLPVTASKIKKIAVLGPNADDAQNQLGDWALGSGQAYPQGREDMTQPRENTTTVLDGIKAQFPGATIKYEAGATIETGETADQAAAVAAARAADLIIVVVGDRQSLRGETKSTATLELQGTQLELLQAIADLKKPFVIDFITSKPQVLPEAIVNASSAIIQQFSPGNLGGKAFAQAIAGEINPAGKLTISIPRHAGQLPVYYNRVRGTHGEEYADMTFAPQWAFGHGLSYSNFVYTAATIDKSVCTASGVITVTVSITNQGPVAGMEIVQIYIHDRVTSATWAVQELKAFKRVTLQSGQTQKVNFSISVGELSIVNAAGVRTIEAGDFELRVAQASDKILFRLPLKVQ
jgi:beta-glucosidase